MFFTEYLSNKAIGAFFIVLFMCYILFISHPIPFGWLILSSFVVFTFFYYSMKLTRSWAQYSDEHFRRKLFKTALIIRVVAVLFLYFFFWIMTGQPFEFKAADSLFYNDIGIHISDIILNGEFNLFSELWFLSISNRGFPIYLGIIYALFFKSILVTRLFNALLGAWSCVLIYDFSKRNFNEPASRIAGIMVMLVPNMIYYCGLHLKETLMVFFIIASINLADKLLRAKHITFKDIVLLQVTVSTIFLFRTVLAVCIIVSLFTSLLIISERISGWNRRIFIVFWVIIAANVLYSAALQEEINMYIARRISSQQAQMQHFSLREGGNKLAKFGKRSIFIPVMLFAPFPTLVNTQQENIMMLSGTYYTRNVYAFFVIIALIMIYRRRMLRDHVLIISYLLSYLAVLASSGFALSGRFHLPVIPFLLVLAGYGITQMNKKNIKYYVPYLVVTSLVIIGWNWFKLAGRGLI